MSIKSKYFKWPKLNLNRKDFNASKQVAMHNTVASFIE